jgi:hypothetical protein
MLKLWNFYRHLLSNWPKNWCASYKSDTESKKYQKNVKFLYSTSSFQLSWKFLCFLFKWYRIGKNIKKIRAKCAKFRFLIVAWPRGELRWAFVLIVLCCFFLYDLRCLPSRVCPWEEAQIRLRRHLTQSQDGALNLVLKIVEFILATASVQLS